MNFRVSYASWILKAQIIIELCMFALVEDEIICIKYASFFSFFFQTSTLVDGKLDTLINQKTYASCRLKSFAYGREIYAE